MDKYIHVKLWYKRWVTEALYITSRSLWNNTLAYQIGISVVFYPCEMILSHIPLPARGKDKKRIATRRLHADCTLIHNVIVMSKWCHHVASQHIQDFSEAFFMFFQYKIWYLVVVNKKKNPLFLSGWDRNIHTSGSPFIITMQASWCQSVILGTYFVIPTSRSWWILIVLDNMDYPDCFLLASWLKYKFWMHIGSVSIRCFNWVPQHDKYQQRTEMYSHTIKQK